MKLWQLLAVFTPFLFVTYQSISKLLPKNSPIFLVNAIASGVGALIMLAFHLFLSNKSQSLSLRTIPLILAIGTLISVGNFLIIKAYSLGAPQSIFTTLFYPLLIVYGVLFGLILWNEKFTAVQFGGLFLIAIGLILVSYVRR